MRRAPASAPTTWSCSAGRERWLDHPYAMYLTIRSFWPGSSRVATVRRPTSGELSVSIVVDSGPSMSCDMPAAIRRPLCLVRCRSSTLVPLATCSSPTSGLSRIADARGSFVPPGSASLATSSDCATIRTESPTGSTS